MIHERLNDALLGLRDSVLAELDEGRAAPWASGEQGRRTCEEDVASHLTALACAVSLGAPAIFAAHITWVRQRLDGRRVPPEWLRLSLHAIRRHVEAADVPMEARAVALLSLDQGEMASRRPLPPAEPTPPELQPYLDVATRGDREATLRIASGWREQGGVDHALRQMARAQHAVGEAWCRGEITIGQEHRATAITTLALSLNVPYTVGSRPTRPLGRAVVACAPGDFHVLGPRIAADLMELRGYEVEFLGACTPAEDLLAVCREQQPAVVGLGVAPLHALPGARSALAALKAELPGTRRLVGGRAARLAGPGALAADQLAPQDFDGLVAA